ncbi:MAG: hypothetical protein JWP61_618 [Friedmanniella sp.]|nr:hypothetical protein [Friedmanniella sp.]
MTAILISMFLILVIAVGTVGLVAVGMEGWGKILIPRVADRMARAAQHLNGDGRPPKRFLRVLRLARRVGQTVAPKTVTRLMH